LTAKVIYGVRQRVEFNAFVEPGREIVAESIGASDGAPRRFLCARLFHDMAPILAP
jgi:hypothetical protein